MKLLGWMHRKFRQNSSEPLKDFAFGNTCTCLTGQPSLDDQHYYSKPNCCTKPFGKIQRDNHHLRESFASLEAARAEEDNLEEESSAALSELFHGFLAIGTLGTDTVFTDPPTPTFSYSVENITEKGTEVTENELKLINDELEKVLGAEGKDDGYSDSSGRNSHVSAGRSSHGSTITLSGKPMEGTENIGIGTIICPLQGYLFGSAIGLPETTVTKKEHRTSLGELFQKTKMAEENSGSKCDKEEKRMEKETDKSAVHLMKRMLKKRMLHTSSRSSTAAPGGTVDTTSETKLTKILHKFHKKVHPESTAAKEKSDKPKNEKSINYEAGYNSGDRMLPAEDIIIFPQRALSKKRTQHNKSQSNPPQVTLGRSDSNGNREYWIKSDTEYLVLEL
ncbi:hypothetical protein LguiB_016346 [Lonicera macranthoides]